MALDPKKHADWEIAQEAEKTMKTVYQLGKEMGLEESELLPYGHYMGKIDYRAVLKRLADKPNGKYIDVTAITPTPLGEGKSTTTIGLVQGLGLRGKLAAAAIRQPSAEGVYRVSMRSSCHVDVAAVCATFGGGGHVKAAGCSINAASKEEVIEKVLVEIAKQLK